MSPPLADPQYHPAVKTLARGLRQRCGVKPGDAIVVACSGGADSVALLRGLALLAPRRNWRLRLIVGHVNHKLRGEQSDDDAHFVGALAADFGCAYELREIRPADQAGNLEANARTLRYRALCDIARHHGASMIATAHHADDQLETVLMRLLRGSASAGLRGIAWRRRFKEDECSLRIHAIRPLLAASPETLRDLLGSLGQSWREDPTNRDSSLVRNRLRHEVIPLLKAIKQDAPSRAVQLSDHFTNLNHLVIEQANRVRETREESTNHSLSRDEARRLNPIVLTQILRRDLIHLGVPRDRIPGHALHPVVQAAKDTEGGQRTFDFAQGAQIRVTAQEIVVTKPA